MAEDKTLSPEQELLEFAERLGRFGYSGRQALHLRFSKLHVMYQRPDYLRIALAIFSDQVAPYGGRFFRLANEDVVYVSREASSEALEKVVARIRLLFSEDPNIIVQLGNDPFFTRYELENSYGVFLTLCRTIAADATAHEREAKFMEQHVVRPEMRPATLQDLGMLEEALGRVDIASVLHRQSVCVMVAGTMPEPVFDETYVSLSDLSMLTGMHSNLLANRWLFQYLTQVLDRSVLTYLGNNPAQLSQPISLNLNIATILSPEFQQFNDSLAPRLRPTLVIEFNKLDVFSDMGAFLFVRDYLKERGFRLCLDGLNHLTAPYYDRQKLGFDLIKIHWSPDSLNSANAEIFPIMQHLVRKAEKARVILCRCDSPDAIRIGQTLDIVMFQGREVDRMLQRKERKATN
ncbi:MAG: EAL domain-containing protein [Alphaproteobacteria bacterium]|nr:EAL domain-containing protein [Alphaproteobacteria bacterium]